MLYKNREAYKKKKIERQMVYSVTKLKISQFHLIIFPFTKFSLKLYLLMNAKCSFIIAQKKV